MRYGFVTCVRLGEACIEEILALGGNLVWLGTLQDDQAAEKSGRIYLDDLAREHGIALSKFRNINDSDALTAIRNADLDWLFIIGWSQIAQRSVLESTRRGVLGMHPTLLPEGRGRAAVPWAILKGLEKTGVTLFKLDEGTDTGPILQQIEIVLAPNETATTLYEKVADAHKLLIRQVWQALDGDTVVEKRQDDSRATEWPGRRPEDGEIVPAEMTTQAVDRYVRALTHPYPGAYTAIDTGRTLRIWSGRPADGRRVDEADGYVLATSDGFYEVLEYEVES